MSSLTLAGAGPEAASSLPASPISTSPTAWFQADNGTGTTTDGVAIAQWNDLSGSGNNITQATGSKQPLLKTAIQNGLPIVRFDGTDDVLGAAFALVQVESIFVVCKFRSIATNGTLFDGNADNSMRLLHNSATTIDMYAGAFGPTKTADTAAFHVLTAIYKSGANLSSLRIDGGAADTTNSVGSGNGGGIRIGADGFGAAAADVGELLLFASEITGTDRTTVEAYLKAKWGTP